MTNKEILEKAIRKAIEGGWQEEAFTDLAEPDDWRVYQDVLGEWKVDNAHDDEIYIEHYIFNHDFAKALWGDGYELGYHEVLNIPAWQYHLKQMVVSEDPIQYLGQHIDK